MLHITPFLPSNWNPKTCKTELKELSAECEEYIKVKAELSDTYIQERVTKISRIQNPYMYCKFLLRKEECKSRNDIEVQQMYHDTKERNIISIAKNNFNWRLCKKNRALFGSGIYFAPSAKYLRQHSSAKITRRATIVCDVLIGNLAVGTKHNEVPREGIDTTTSKKHEVYVKYNDDEFYPKYVVYYFDEKYKKKPKIPKNLVEEIEKNSAVN